MTDDQYHKVPASLLLRLRMKTKLPLRDMVAQQL